MSLSYALLGLLTAEPRTGYELTKAFETSIGRYAWQAGHTSIYPELGKLADKELIEITHEGPRNSRTYDVTPAGREQLRAWLLDPPTQPARVRNEEGLRMFLLSVLEPEDALVVLRRIADQAAASAAELREIRSQAFETVELPTSTWFGQFAAEYGLRQHEATHDWALWAIEQMERRRRGTHASAGEK